MLTLDTFQLRVTTCSLVSACAGYMYDCVIFRIISNSSILQSVTMTNKQCDLSLSQSKQIMAKENECLYKTNPNPVHSPRSPTLSLIIAATLATLSWDRTSRCVVIRLLEQDFFKSSSPFSVKHEAITLNPCLSRWRARRLPKPESQPVMYTYLLPLSGTLGSSLTQRYR